MNDVPVVIVEDQSNSHPPRLPFTDTSAWSYEIGCNGGMGRLIIANDWRGAHAAQIHIQRENRAFWAASKQLPEDDMRERARLASLFETGSHKPRYGWRGLHVDAGRRFFSASMLCHLIDYMDQARLNVLNLHVSENEGYRLASRVHPEVSSPQHLSFDDIQRVRKYAEEKYITIIPSFDLPGHLGAVLQAHPWAQLHGPEGPIRGALDITNPKAVDLVWELLDEIVALFESSYVNLGGDEYLDFRQGVPALREAAEAKLGEGAREHDLWVDFLNETHRRLRDRGVRAFIWNDGIHADRMIDPDEDFPIQYWTRWGAHMESAVALAERGHDLVNWDGDRLYFVLRDDPNNTYPTAESVLKEFDPDLYPGKGERAHLPGHLGAVFSIWCDAPNAISDEELLRLVHGPIMAFGQVMWPVRQIDSPDELMLQFPEPAKP